MPSDPTRAAAARNVAQLDTRAGIHQRLASLVPNVEQRRFARTLAALEAHHQNALHAQTRLAHEARLKGEAALEHAAVVKRASSAKEAKLACHLEAMRADGASQLESLRVDGGMVANDWVLQRLADLLGVPVERPTVAETTALGAAYLAGLSSGFFTRGGGDHLAHLGKAWSCEARFEPAMAEDKREEAYASWKAAVARVRAADA